MPAGIASVAGRFSGGRQHECCLAAPSQGGITGRTGRHPRSLGRQKPGWGRTWKPGHSESQRQEGLDSYKWARWSPPLFSPDPPGSRTASSKGGADWLEEGGVHGRDQGSLGRKLGCCSRRGDSGCCSRREDSGHWVVLAHSFSESPTVLKNEGWGAREAQTVEHLTRFQVRP